MKFTSSGKSEALKQMGVELTIRGPSKPSVEFCHIVLIGIGRPQLWSHLIPSIHPSNQAMKMDNIQSQQLYNNQLRSMDTPAYFNLLSSPRAKRECPKGLRAESASAFTGRRNSHSGRGEDFLTGQPDFFYGNSCNSGTESRKMVSKVGN